MVSFFAEVKIFRFWPKTMDYNKVFLPKSRRFSAALLLHSGRCYGAEICVILFLLRYPFRKYFFSVILGWGICCCGGGGRMHSFTNVVKTFYCGKGAQYKSSISTLLGPHIH